MTVLKELCVVQETYTNRDGQEKKKWLKVGEIHGGKNGEYIVLFPHINLAAIPRKEGDSRLFVSMFDPKPRDGGQHPSQANSKDGGFADMDSDVPF